MLWIPLPIGNMNYVIAICYRCNMLLFVRHQYCSTDSFRVQQSMIPRHKTRLALLSNANIETGTCCSTAARKLAVFERKWQNMVAQNTRHVVTIRTHQHHQQQQQLLFHTTTQHPKQQIHHHLHTTDQLTTKNTTQCRVSFESTPSRMQIIKNYMTVLSLYFYTKDKQGSSVTGIFSVASTAPYGLWV